MPIYEFECKQCKEVTDVFFGFDEEQEMLCDCGNDMSKVYRAVGVIFNGPGFYKTGG